MSVGSLLRRLVGELVDFVESADDLLGHDAARAAVLQDLGAAPDVVTGKLVLPEAPLAAIKEYRDNADADTQADIEAAGNLAIILNAVIDQIESWQGTDWAGRGDTFINGLVDLLGSNWVRRRMPTWFLVMQAVSITSELTGSLAPGDQAHTRFVNAFKTIFSFVWNPGRTLDDLDDTRPGADGSTLNTGRDTSFLFVDGLIRGVLAAIAVVDQTKDPEADNVLGDIVVGWDSAALDVDATARPTAADVLSGRMVSAALRHDGDEASEQLRLTCMYLPRRLGTPSRPHQLFLALGGSFTLDQVLNPGATDDPTWRFRVKISSDAGAALLISGEEPHVQANAEAGNTSASVGWAGVPDETGISYALPHGTGTRLELGEVGFVITLSGTGARVLFRLDQSALVVDSEDKDGFIRKLLGGRPYKKTFSLGLGYDADLGFIHELHTPSKDSAAQPAFNSAGPAGPPDLELTLPLGGGSTLGINVHEVVLRMAWRSTDEEPNSGWAVAASGLISFSTQLGPVYARVDRLGLQFSLDTMTLQKDRNLGIVNASVDATRPTGIALDLQTGPVSGGGAIQFDPATGDYAGALMLRVGKQITITCLGLASTKDREGNPLTSFIVIGTVEHLGWTVGFVTFDGFGLLYASDRTLDVAAVRAALPTGQLKHILFPADPLKHLPEMASALRTFFPPKEGVHIYGLLLKLTFGALPLLRADLALMLEVDDHSESARFLVLGRVSSVLPQASHPLITLNLDVVGVFDLDTGSAALDAVLYESKLCGRFVLTGAAAFRRERGQGFALAIGGFNPRFSPPANFPAVPRITVALTTGDNPRLIIEAYLAITPNTLQFGAKASLYAAAYGFSVEGYIGFDVLVQFWPPHFIADFAAGVQLKRGSRNLFKVDLKGTIEGPIPLRVAGKATFGILWWDYTVGFDKTIIGGDDAVVTEALDVLTELVARLADPHSWRTELPPALTQIAGVRTAPRTDTLQLHPLGRLVVQQGLVPLNTVRDIDRVGAFVPRDARRFTITHATVGGVETGTAPVGDEFPDSQFFDMTDAERLAAPGMVVREAGVSFGNDAYLCDASAGVPAPFHYTEIVVDDEGVPHVQPDPVPADPAHVLTGLRIAAATRAHTRVSVAERYTGVERPDAPRLAAAGLAGLRR